MKCSLTECQWNGFGSCCPESEEILNAALPNSTECPSYWDLKTAAENERQELIEGLMLNVRDMGLKNPEMYDRWLKELGWEELVTKAYDMIVSLWDMHRRNQILDSMLEEIKQIGPDKFKRKYLNIVCPIKEPRA
jgi:hypothetical protein